MFLRPFYQFVNQRIDVIVLFDMPGYYCEGKIAIFAKILKIQICHLNQFTIAGQHTPHPSEIKKCSVFNENWYRDLIRCEENESVGPDGRQPTGLKKGL